MARSAARCMSVQETPGRIVSITSICASRTALYTSSWSSVNLPLTGKLKNKRRVVIVVVDGGFVRLTRKTKKITTPKRQALNAPLVPACEQFNQLGLDPAIFVTLGSIWHNTMHSTRRDSTQFNSTHLQVMSLA